MTDTTHRLNGIELCSQQTCMNISIWLVSTVEYVDEYSEQFNHYTDRTCVFLITIASNLLQITIAFLEGRGFQTFTQITVASIWPCVSILSFYLKFWYSWRFNRLNWTELPFIEFHILCLLWYSQLIRHKPKTFCRLNQKWFVKLLLGL